MRRLALVLLAGPGLLLTACGGSADQPRALPAVTGSPAGGGVPGAPTGGAGGASASASAAASASAVPSASAVQGVVRTGAPAGAPTAQDAVAYTRVLYQKLDAAFQASDADAVRRLSDPGCKTCERYEVALAKAAERGLRIRGSSFRILTAEAPPVEHDLAFVEVLIVSPPRASVRASGGGIEEDLPADPATRLTVILKYTGSGHWLLREIERAS